MLEGSSDTVIVKSNFSPEFGFFTLSSSLVQAKSTGSNIAASNLFVFMMLSV